MGLPHNIRASTRRAAGNGFPADLNNRSYCVNILFLTLVNIRTINDTNIYCDLMREIISHGHHIYTISIDSQYEDEAFLDSSYNIDILHINSDNSRSENNLIKKGMAYLRFGRSVPNAVKKYFSGVHFDYVIYATPPLTFYKTVRMIKQRDGSRTYLLLKDIFPQNAVDMRMMSASGTKGLVYRYFKRIEKKLYDISDTIGCMSRANVDYLLEHNPQISAEKVEVCPNTIEVMDIRVTESQKTEIRKKYEIPTDRIVFVYGGNLGKPQDIPFIIQCLKREAGSTDAFFLIVGDGTDYPLLEKYVDSDHPNNVKLMRSLPRKEYDLLTAACDIGLIFLHHDFTIPNFPSRLLGYMQAGLPVLACTDNASDIGKVIEDGRFGLWCESDSVDAFHRTVRDMIDSADRRILSENARDYLLAHYTSQISYSIIFRGKTSI